MNVYEVNTWLWLFARGKPSLGGISLEETALKKKARREDQVKGAVETRRRVAGVGKRLGHHRNEACVWLISISVRTSTYWYVLVWTFVTWNLYFLKIDIVDDNPSISLLNWSCTLLQFTLGELPGCMRNLHVMFLVHTGAYQYVPDKNSCTCMYRYIPVHAGPVRTGTYRYVRFCLILSRCIGFQMKWTIKKPKNVGLVLPTPFGNSPYTHDLELHDTAN